MKNSVRSFLRRAVLVIGCLISPLAFAKAQTAAQALNSNRAEISYICVMVRERRDAVRWHV